jgi:hypothetical protein
LNPYYCALSRFLRMIFIRLLGEKEALVTG